MELPQLDAVEQRVLGSLLEKELTVPASYPMTVNALRVACNQSSSRDPVTDLDESTVHQTLRELKQRGLVRVVWADTGRRTMKYLQTLTEVVDLDPAARALVTVLLLRGPQPAGALRSRTERLHAFADRDDVAAGLSALAVRTPALARPLSRQRGQQDERWVHLLGPVDSAGMEIEAAAPADNSRDVLADGPDVRDARVRAAYDTVAESYAEQLADELDGLPFERWLLARVVELAGDRPLVEVGCGPGHVAAHAAGLGADASGIDLSPVMVEQARQLFPHVRYDVGDLRSLGRPPTAAAWGAVLAWYSLIHLSADELPAAVAALARPLAPGGVLVLALHAGREVRHIDEWFGRPVDLDAVLHEPRAVVAAVAAAGLGEPEWYRRGPIAARGEDTERLYVVARALTR